MSEQPFQDDIKTMIGTMNRVTDITQRDRIIEQEIQLEGKKLEMKGKLRSLYASQNIAVTDAVLDEAIQKELDARFDPPPPMTSTQELVAGLWMHRTLLTILTSLFIILGTVVTVSIHHALKSRRAAEALRQSQSVHRLVNEADGELNRADALLKQHLLLKQKIEDTGGQIQRWNSNIIPISQKKLLEVENGMQSINSLFDDLQLIQKKLATAVAKASYNGSDTVADPTKKLRDLSPTLETRLKSLHGQLVGISNIDILQRRLDGLLANSPKVAPAVIEAKKSAAYSALNEGNLDQAERIIENLQVANMQAMKDAELVQALNETVERLRNTKALDEAATTALNGMMGTCKEAMLNPPDAKRVVSNANDLIRRIEENFEVHIVSRDKTAFKRTFSFKSSGNGKSISYVVVEARDKSGNPVKIPIVNAEDGKTETVAVWAEEVPDEVWNKISADKRADGIVDDHLFATKKSGKLEMSYEKIQMSTRRITRW